MATAQHQARRAEHEAWVKAARQSPWHELRELSRLSNEALLHGELTEEEYSYVQAILQDRLTHRRKAAPTAPRALLRGRTGARPRSPASLIRRRRAMAFGFLPPEFLEDGRWGIYASLAIMAEEAMKRGACSLVVGKIAALAGYCRSTVQEALRHATRMGWITVERRRDGRFNRPNRVTIACRRWRAWLAEKARSWRGRGPAPAKIGLTKEGTTRTVDLKGVGLRPTNPFVRAPLARGGPEPAT